MNDVISPIIKLLSSLVSVRAAFRFIFVAIGLIFSWVKTPPILSPYNLPEQISGTVSTFFGIALGTIVSAVMFSIANGIVSIIKEKNKNKLELAHEEEERKKDAAAIDVFLMNFKNNLKYYDARAKEIIEDLNERERSFSTEQAFSSDTGPEALNGLLKNQVIEVVMNINKSTTVYKINPQLKEYVRQYFYDYYQKESDEFLNYLDIYKASLLDIMAKKSVYSKEPFPYPKDVLKDTRMFMPCFEMIYFGKSSHYYFSFRRNYREHFEKILGKSFYDKVEVVLR